MTPDRLSYSPVRLGGMWQAEIQVDLGAISANVARLRAGDHGRGDGGGQGRRVRARHGAGGPGRAARRRHLARRLHPRRGARRCAGPASPRRCWPGCSPPGAAAARGRRGRRRPLRRLAGAARRAGRGGPPDRAAGPGAPQGRHRAVPRRRHRRPTGRPCARRPRRREADGDIEVVGVWSHLVHADVPDHATTDRQLAAFVDGAGRRRRLRAAPARSGTWPTRRPR